MNKPKIIYTGPSGWEQRSLSHSAWSEYMESPAKFKWKRIKGYKDRMTWGQTMFGNAIQDSIKAFYEDQSDPVAIFQREWNKQQGLILRWPKNMNWEKFNTPGIELMKEFIKRYEADSYRFKNTVFPQLRKNTLKIHDKGSGVDYESIPDLIGEDEKGQFCVDLKAYAGPVREETPGIVVNDLQLRTQAAVTGIYRVGLWVFIHTPERPDRPSEAQIRNSVEQWFPGHETSKDFYQAALVEALRRLGDCTIQEAFKIADVKEIEDPTKLLRNMRKSDSDPIIRMIKNLDRFIEESLNSLKPIWRIQWIEGTMSKEWAESAVQDQLTIIPQIQGGWFPCRCGVRWPSDGAHRCAFRGLCLEDASPNATPEQLTEWRRITKENLITPTDVLLEGL